MEHMLLPSRTKKRGASAWGRIEVAGIRSGETRFLSVVIEQYIQQKHVWKGTCNARTEGKEEGVGVVVLRKERCSSDGSGRE